MACNWTQEDLNAFDEAMKNRALSGTLEVKFPSGQEIRFESLKSMQEYRNFIIGEINRCARKSSGSKMQASLASFC